jgi:hypothetical protein
MRGQRLVTSALALICLGGAAVRCAPSGTPPPATQASDSKKALQPLLPKLGNSVVEISLDPVGKWRFAKQFPVLETPDGYYLRFRWEKTEPADQRDQAIEVTLTVCPSAEAAAKELQAIINRMSVGGTDLADGSEGKMFRTFGYCTVLGRVDKVMINVGCAGSEADALWMRTQVIAKMKRLLEKGTGEEKSTARKP